MLGEKIEKITLKKCIRVNTLKFSNKDAEEFFKNKKIKFTKVSFLENGYYIEDNSFNIVSTKEYLNGFFYIQEAASQVPVEILEPKEGETVLDMCASPGSKSTQMSQHMKNEGTLVCLDSNQSRIQKLINNLERTGVTNSIILQADGRYFEYTSKFDKILLDAPCSGNYVVDKEWLEKKENYVIDEIKERQKLQKELLKSACNLLKKDGILVYSTCSLEPEENEEVISFALENLPLSIEKIEKNIGSQALTEFDNKVFTKNTNFAKRFWPNITKTQGFFVAKLRKLE
jgi:NOL1/NOP2/sun family putative RNA methylase